MKLQLTFGIVLADNAVMIGWASMYRFLEQDYDEYEIETRPKWDIEELQ